MPEANKPAARQAQEPSPQNIVTDLHAATDDQKTAKQHTRDLFAWLDQVALDRDLPPSAFKVAYIIGKHLNRETGDAWPSTARIAEGCALKQSTVVELVTKLETSGHLAINRGCAGRGHSHRYRVIIKHRRADISGRAKTSGARAENIGDTEIKHRPADMNLLKNHLRNNKGAPPGARTCYVDREDKTEQEPVSISTARAVIGALEDHLPFDCCIDHAEKEVAELLTIGFKEKDLIAIADRYTARVTKTREPIVPLATLMHRQLSGKSCLTLASS